MIFWSHTLISLSSLMSAVSCGLPRNHLSDSNAFCSLPDRITSSECGESGIHMYIPTQSMGVARDTMANVRYDVYGPTMYSTRKPATKKNCINVPSDDLRRVWNIRPIHRFIRFTDSPGCWVKRIRGKSKVGFNYSKTFWKETFE